MWYTFKGFDDKRNGSLNNFVVGRRYNLKECNTNPYMTQEKYFYVQYLKDYDIFSECELNKYFESIQERRRGIVNEI